MKFPKTTLSKPARGVGNMQTKLEQTPWRLYATIQWRRLTSAPPLP